MNIISLFSGCGGLDLGFSRAGFDVIWANEKDEKIWKTYEENHPNTFLDKRSISEIPISEIPNCIGIIGGPPCQSWSEAGNGDGAKDERGRLFYHFIKIIREKKPLFFVAENVSGMLNQKHKNSLTNIKGLFKRAGYKCHVKSINAADYGIPQNRKRIFFIGFREDLNISFKMPNRKKKRIVKDVIFNLRNNAIASLEYNRTNGNACMIPNHEYWQGSYSYIFMSRNRVLDWKLPSYTIQASGRQMVLHPQAPKMIKVRKDVRKFDKKKLHLYRRLTIRESARIQTFPDDFIFYYENLHDGYKMVGNAVPVDLARVIAKKIYQAVSMVISKKSENFRVLTKKHILRKPSLVSRQASSVLV